MFFRAQIAEIRDRDESARIGLNVDADYLESPGYYDPLLDQAAGLRLTGLDQSLPGLPAPTDPAEEIAQAACLGTLAMWLSGKPVEVETGWRSAPNPKDPDRFRHRVGETAAQGLESLIWFNFADPEPSRAALPPWSLRPGLDRAALCDSRFEPRDWAESTVEAARSGQPKSGAVDFIDLDRADFREKPEIHLPRLWNHFMEKISRF